MPQQHGLFRLHKELQNLQTALIIWLNFILILKQNMLVKKQKFYPANFSIRSLLLGLWVRAEDSQHKAICRTVVFALFYLICIQEIYRFNGSVFMVSVKQNNYQATVNQLCVVWHETFVTPTLCSHLPQENTCLKFLSNE